MAVSSRGLDSTPVARWARASRMTQNQTPVAPPVPCGTRFAIGVHMDADSLRGKSFRETQIRPVPALDAWIGAVGHLPKMPAGSV